MEKLLNQQNHRLNMAPKFKLFCLPHAGGNKYAYKSFVDAAPAFIKVIPLEYPGRGERIQEKLITDVMELVKLLLADIRSELHAPYAIYGHSMGSLVGYLLAREIRKVGYASPKFLFFTGSEGPATRKNEKIRHLLPENELIEELKSLGGLSDEVSNEPDIIKFFLPIIRADFHAVETYQHVKGENFDIPINVAIGTEEKVTLEEAKSWQMETRVPIELIQFHGNHFFIFDHTERIMKLITEKLLE
jgi:surfactin synthase thioesterase subunit